MRRTLEFRPSAREEFDDAANWYEEQQDGLRSEFVYAVDAALQRVVDNPLSFPIVEGSKIRRALVSKFPYAIFFETDDGQVLVYAIFHTSRNPMIWRARLG